MNRRALPLAAALACVLLAPGCSWEQARRTGYESVESMRHQQCLDRLEEDCSTDRTPYEDYQSQRQHLQQQAP